LAAYFFYRHNTYCEPGGNKVTFVLFYALPQQCFVHV